MDISPINGNELLPEMTPIKNTNLVPENKAVNFKDLLDTAMSQVNDLQLKSDQAIKAFATGEPIELHDVMISMEKANLALQLTVQVRNRLVEAYQQLNQMQV